MLYNVKLVVDATCYDIVLCTYELISHGNVWNLCRIVPTSGIEFKWGIV